MPLPSPVTQWLDVLRSQTTELLDQARSEAEEQVAHFTGRGAGWVDEAGHALAESTVVATTRLTETAGEHAAGLADRVAVVVGRWSGQLGDRLVSLGEELGGPRRGRD